MIWAAALPTLGDPSANPSPASAPDRPAGVNPSSESPTIETWARTLRDTEASAADRADAAESLIGSSEKRAATLASQLLRESPSARRAIVLALTSLEASPPGSLGPALLEAGAKLEDPSLDEPLAAALGRYADGEFLAELEATAEDPDRPTSERQVAVRALGYRPTQAIAGRLIELTAADHPEAVREAAFAALIHMTGRDWLDADRERWLSWWRRARELQSAAWRDALLQGVLRRSARLAAQQERLVDRLVNATARLYRTTPSEARPALLLDMLRDPLPAMRAQGVRLTHRRFSDGEPLSPEIRDRARAMLDDPAALVLERVVHLLRDLRDEQAVEVVASRLARGAQTRVPSLRAYLQMIAQAPRAEAAPALVGLLSHPTVYEDAALALAAIIESGRLSSTDPGPAEALGVLRERVKNSPDSIGPGTVRLYGLLGEPSDWRRIRDWLEHERDDIQRAAARVWVETGRPLPELARHVKDPAIRPIVYAAAAERGRAPSTLMQIASDPPEEGQMRQLWRRAMLEMSRRVPPGTMIQIEALLHDQTSDWPLRDQLLGMAIDRLAEAEAESESVPRGESGSASTPAAGGDAEPDAEAGGDADADTEDEDEDEDEDKAAAAPEAEVQAGRAGGRGADLGVEAESRRGPRASSSSETAADSEQAKAETTAAGSVHGEDEVLRSEGESGPASNPTSVSAGGEDGAEAASTAGASGREPSVAAATSDSRRETWAELLLLRGELRVASGDPAMASSDLTHPVLREGPLTRAQHQRLHDATLRARLALGEFNRAFEYAERVIEQAADATVIDRVASLLLDRAAQHLQAEQLDRVRQLLTAVRTLAGDRLSEPLVKRMRAIERAADGDVTPEKVPAAEKNPSQPRPAEGQGEGVAETADERREAAKRHDGV